MAFGQNNIERRKAIEAKAHEANPAVLSELEALPWVKSVRHNWSPGGSYVTAHDEYIVETKPDALLRAIRCKAQVHENDNDGTAPTYTWEGEKLDKPVYLPMPSLSIALTARYQNLRVWLANMPTQEYFMQSPLASGYPHPAKDYFQRDGNVPNKWSICLGAYYTAYNKAKTWRERAEVMAEYFQTALPEGGSSQTPSGFMYYLGRLPEEHVEFIKVGEPFINYVEQYFEEDGGEDDDEDEDDDGDNLWD